jgi:hypothetical protein
MYRSSLFASGVLALLCSITVARALAVEPRTEHTFQLSPGESPPSATAEDAGWLAGRWEGVAFGQRFEEYWSEPSAGSMLGTFKLIGDEGVEFYELMEISVSEGRLGLKVKHFSADFSAWEDKPDYVHFKLVAVEPDALHFSGISFYRQGPDNIEAYLLMRDGEKLREEKLVYSRVK